MHLLKTLFALIPLIAAVVGYTLPEGTPDGFYSITFDANGNSNLTRLPDALVARSDGQTRTVVSSAKFAKRDSGNLAKRDTWGYTGRSFSNHNDYNACTDGWHNYYAGGGTVPPRTVYVLQVGQAILAVCNYLWVFPHSDGAGYVNGFNGHMDQTYGFWTTGWVHWDVNDVTYWRDLAGTAFCTNM